MERMIGRMPFQEHRHRDQIDCSLVSLNLVSLLLDLLPQYISLRITFSYT